MNRYLQDYLISPETRCSLSLIDNTIDGLKNGLLEGNDLFDVFSIVNGIPILLPKNQVADYNYNILDILFKEQTNEICHDISSKAGNNYELIQEEFRAYLLNNFGKEGILNKYKEYSELPQRQKLSWFAKLDKNQKSDNKAQIPSSKLNEGLTYATPEIGKRRMETNNDMIKKWAFHLNDYANLVTEHKSGTIVELGTGACLGTYGVVDSGLGESKLISIDIDYSAASNAKGIAKYLEIENIVDPIVANFWYLPFKSESIDIVCSHYGLDEAREVSCVLSEISRILKKGGKFINVSRKDPTLRIKHDFGCLGFSEDEYINMARWAGFYSGMDDLVEVAKENNLILDYHKGYSPSGSHERVLSAFKKK
jgi:ubiquinone/menaquinone biosynthesis C-methylase UbiE/uncharacterized protein YbaR (Trm112 family)